MKLQDHLKRLNLQKARKLRSLLASVLVALPTLFAGCTALNPAQQPGTVPGPSAATPKPTDIVAYLDTFDHLAPGDPVRQEAELADAYTAAQELPTASNRLRYALALGAAGHASSNPVEAKRLITELLAGQHDLRSAEVSLANAYLREFDARVALYADLSRQREEAERKLAAVDADGDKRVANLNAETQRLKKALADAERKLEAVAEMERSLIEDVPPASPQQ